MCYPQIQHFYEESNYCFKIEILTSKDGDGECTGAVHESTVVCHSVGDLLRLSNVEEGSGLEVGDDWSNSGQVHGGGRLPRDDCTCAAKLHRLDDTVWTLADTGGRGINCNENNK